MAQTSNPLLAPADESLSLSFFLMQEAYSRLAENVIATRKVEVFNNPSFGEVRTSLDESGEPWFCLVDVCRILELRVDGVMPRLREGGYNRIVVTDALGRNQETTFVNEQNLYRVIMRSDKPNAEPFQDWVCGEVLPSIRKTGRYSIDRISRKELALMVIQSEEEKERLLQENKAQADKIAEDAPKVIFAEAVETSDSVCLVGELAKILKQNGIKDMGQNRLYKWLRSHSYLGNKGDNYNLPTQKAMELGVFKVIKGKRIDRHTGGVIVTRTAKVTTKGLKYFINKFHNSVAVL